MQGAMSACSRQMAASCSGRHIPMAGTVGGWRVQHQRGAQRQMVDAPVSGPGTRSGHLTRCRRAALAACAASSKPSQSSAAVPGCSPLAGLSDAGVRQRRGMRCQARSAAERFNSMPPPDALDDSEDEDRELTADEIDERLDEAASFISVMDDLRPLEGSRYNPFFEVWRLFSRIPPKHRHRLLDDLEPGCIRSLWKASMGRFVMDDERALEVFGEVSVWDDFPSAPGQVLAFEGKCERFVIRAEAEGGGRLMVDRDMQETLPRGKPWLRPSPASVELPQERFTSYFFLHPASGEIHARTALRFLGRLERWWLPIYARLHVELVLTPLQADAGADLSLVYPTDDSTGVAWQLEKEDLPVPRWPEPDPSGWSPFSQSGKDYMRVIGPGVYVGCAYRCETLGDYVETNFVYFILARRTYDS